MIPLPLTEAIILNETSKAIVPEEICIKEPLRCEQLNVHGPLKAMFAMGEQACMGCLRTLARTDKLELIESGSVTGFSKALLLNTDFYTSKREFKV